MDLTSNCLDKATLDDMAPSDIMLVLEHEPHTIKDPELLYLLSSYSEMYENYDEMKTYLSDKDERTGLTLTENDQYLNCKRWLPEMKVLLKAIAKELASRGQHGNYWVDGRLVAY